ncbi:MAG: hypothetical protein JWN25_1866 [Verrucomicrobiales bacterium]|jgi:hypothetical protein|nr:hypothetical protein [Verrucomicrobiales bacterium]MDB6129797.1 hypothetical protein [Verrucomicrobiales bacterium]
MNPDNNQGTSNKDLLEGSVVAGDESTGIPVLTTWKAVYWFVLGAFVIWVAVLALLTRLYA